MTAREEYEAKLADLERQNRWTATAVTWAQKAARLLSWRSRPDADKHVRSLAAWDAYRLAGALASALEEIVPLIPDDAFEDFRSDFDPLARMVRRRSTAAKLAETSGRTEAEAAAFLAKSKEMQEA